jgi:hypothetical protein
MNKGKMMKYKICSDRVLWKKIDKEIVILDIENDSYFSLNDAGSRVWELLSRGLDIKSISGQIAKEYRADIKKVMKDVESVILKLKREKLIIPE